MKGILPQQNQEAEQSILGACLIDPEVTKLVVSRITNDDVFYKPCHKPIFNAIFSLYHKGEAIDIITLTNELRAKNLLREAGDTAYIMHMADILPSTANVEYYLNIVLEKAALRQVQREALNILQKINTGNKADDIAKDLNNIAHNLNDRLLVNRRIDLYHVKEAVGELYNEILDSPEGIGRKQSIRTGYPSLDNKLIFQPSYLIFIVGRPSSGKTTYAFDLAIRMSANGTPVYFGSYEVAKRFALIRLLCQSGMIENRKVMFGPTKDISENLTCACNKLYNQPLYFSHKPLAVEEIGGIIEKIHSKEGKKPVVFIDRFELIKEEYIHQDSGEQSRLARISNKLRRLKDDYNIPLVCLVQMNREIEKRASKVPQLSDLKGTGAAEENAQVVLFVHRDKELNLKQKNENKLQTAELVIGKNMNGATGKLNFRFDSEIPSFFELAEREEQVEKSIQHKEGVYYD